MKYRAKELKGNVNVSRISPLKEFFLLLAGALGIAAVIYIVLGFAVDLVVPHLPGEIEERIGALYSKLYVSTKKTDAGVRLQELLGDLLKELPEEERNYKVYLIPSARVNALALPGRNIVVFSNLVKEAKSENELSFVLAHELGHFAHKDHLRGLGRRLVLLAISVTLFGQDRAVSKFLLNSLVNVEMKFSRRQETMADLWALDLLFKRYGQVVGTTDFLKRLTRKEKKGRLFYYFATHPYPRVRVKTLEQKTERKGYLIGEKIPLDKVFKDMKSVSPPSS